MYIYSFLLATLLFSVLATPTLAHTVGSKSISPAEQNTRTHLVAQNPKEVRMGININTADAKTLLELKGIGLKKAQTIISYREQNGPFKSVDDLLHVKGINKKIIDQNHNKIVV